MPAFREQGKGTRTSVHMGISGGGLDECLTSMLLNRSPIQANGSKWTEEEDNPPIQCIAGPICQPVAYLVLIPCKPWTNQQIQCRLQPLKGGIPQCQKKMYSPSDDQTRSTQVTSHRQPSSTTSPQIGTTSPQILWIMSQ